jgi:acyl-CoA synthetase (AMP-forming)/AMP-acid ligase II
MAATPLYFGGARYMTMAYLFMGATVVLYPAPYQAEELAGAVNEKLITSLFLVPTLLRRLLEMPKSSLPLFAGLRLLLSSGSSLYPQERRTIMRELCPSISTARPRAAAFHCCGPNIPTRCRGRWGKLCSVPKSRSSTISIGQWSRTVGAIRYRGGSVADSYYRNPEESATAFRDGWYYPGDLGRFDADGFLYLTGRFKDMIIRGGVADVPTIAETGLPGFRAVTWYAMVAPPDTPAAIADKINRDVTDIVNVPAVSDKIRDTLQMDPIGNTRAQAKQLFVDDTELWAKVIKEANVTID